MQINRGLSMDGSAPLIWLYVLSGAVAAGLLVYLVYALLRAEEF